MGAALLLLGATGELPALASGIVFVALGLVLLRRTGRARPEPPQAAQPAPGPEPEPAIAAEPEPEPAAEPEPEPAAAPEPEPAAAPAPEPEAAPAPEAEPEAAPAPEAEPEPAAESEPGPASAAEPEPVPGAEPEPAPEPDPEPALEPEPVPGAEPDPEPAPEPEPQPERQPQQDPERHPEPDPAPGPEPEPEAEPEREAGSEPEPAPEPEPARDPGPRDPWGGTLLVPQALARDLPASAFGVAPAVVDGSADMPLPAYVRRDVDDAIDRGFAEVAASRAGGLFVVRGGPVSGLSRTLWEAVRRHVPDRPTLVLRAPAAFPTGVDDGQPFLAVVDRLETAGVAGPSRPVVVVPDGQEHLGRGLSVAAIERLFRVASGSVLVVAMDAPRLDVPEIVAEPTEAWLRGAAEPHLVRGQFSDTEVARATASLPDLGHRPGTRGLPAWFSAAEGLRDRYSAGRQAGSAGAALVAAAAAWRAATLRCVVPLAALGDLTAVVLRTWGASAFEDADPELRTAIAWAREPVAHGRSLLHLVPGDREGVRAAGGVVDAVGTDEVLDEPDFWTALLDHVAAVEALDVARVAAARGLDDLARAALAVAQETDEVEVRARAALHLGVFEEQLGHPEAAVPAYRAAAASDHPEHAPVAGFHLGGVLEAMQRGPEAEQIYRSVIATGHRDAAPMSAFNLGWMLQHTKRLDEAAEVYETAMASGHPDAAAMAGFNLGWVFEQQRRLREAEAVYRQAMDTGHPDVAPLAAVSLGILLERLQRAREARSLYERVVNTGHEEAAAAARLRLQARTRR